ncbi:MAG: caspase family protein [Thermoplasmatales archaeon]|nr:caspase family protein [Thermoplasmatales archaeon]
MKNSKIAICVFIATILILSIVPSIIVAADEVSNNVEKEFKGPKVVFDEKAYSDNAKAPPEGKGKPPKPPKPPKVDKWAVIVGIADYKGVGNDLLYPDDDAQDMYDYLISKGYPSKNIKLLLNGKANANNIIRAIDWMNKQEKKTTSECVFFYSGHGSTYDGYNDGDDEYTDEAIVSADLYLILDGQLRERFSSFTSQKIAFIFDTCFSGGMNDLIGVHTPTTYDGRVVVTASDEYQYSWDGDESMQNGVFTYHYMDGLSTYNTVKEAYTYAAPLAHDDVLEMYGAIMDPQIFDTYTGNWEF